MKSSWCNDSKAESVLFALVIFVKDGNREYETIFLERDTDWISKDFMYKKPPPNDLHCHNNNDDARLFAEEMLWWRIGGNFSLLTSKVAAPAAGCCQNSDENISDAAVAASWKWKKKVLKHIHTSALFFVCRKLALVKEMEEMGVHKLEQHVAFIFVPLCLNFHLDPRVLGPAALRKTSQAKLSVF